jgi:hypothetical protein
MVSGGWRQIAMIRPWGDRLLLVLSVCLILYGLAVVKIVPLLGDSLNGTLSIRHWFELTPPWLIDKPRLGPLRLLHFGALAYVAARTLPRCAIPWNRFAPRAVILCGRHSLAIYCAGALLAYLSGIAFLWIGSSASAIAIVGLDASVITLAIAAMLESWSGRVRASPSGRGRTA